jgi:hypothetical protein
MPYELSTTTAHRKSAMSARNSLNLRIEVPLKAFIIIPCPFIISGEISVIRRWNV